jgi:cyclopropane-fatty-acyl-phospholipid synthase
MEDRVMLFTSLLKYGIRKFSVRVVNARGKELVFGDGSPPRCTIRLNKTSLDYILPLNPAISVPEAIMSGDLTIEDGTLFDFIELAAINYRYIEAFPLLNVFRWLGIGSRKVRQYNPIGIAQKNAAHHYDLSSDLYELFLDRDRQYSCAYFSYPEEELEAAQIGKKRHLASKLLLDREGLSVLDIGSGWGGLGMYIANVTNANVTGVTLSSEQYKSSNKRALNTGLNDRLEFHLQDYRELSGKFDRIVSVGMFEHVGKKKLS